MDQKLPTKPKTPSIFARFEGKPRRLILLFVGALVTIVLFLVFVQYVLKAERKAASREDQEKGELAKLGPENKLVEEEKNQLKIFNLTEIDQFSKKLQADIDTFESEAKYYHQHFAELLTSTKTAELHKYDWVIGYFKKRWDERLPPLQAPGDYRHNLEILLKTIKKAIQKDKGYTPKQEVRDAIDRIRDKVTKGKLLYRKHNQLLDALLRSIGQGPQENPDTIKSLVLQEEDRIITEEAKRQPWKNDEDNPMPFLPPAENEILPRDSASSNGGAIDDLYREEKKNRSNP